MRRSARVKLMTYRGHRLDVRDEAGEGWSVAIYAPGYGKHPEILRNSVPNGLEPLLSEARQRVDRRLDGPEWAPEP